MSDEETPEQRQASRTPDPPNTPNPKLWNLFNFARREPENAPSHSQSSNLVRRNTCSEYLQQSTTAHVEQSARSPKRPSHATARKAGNSDRKTAAIPPLSQRYRPKPPLPDVAVRSKIDNEAAYSGGVHSARLSLKEHIALRKQQEQRNMQQQETSESGPESQLAIPDPYTNADSCKDNNYKSTGVCYNIKSNAHRCEWDENHQENPRRLQQVLQKLDEHDLIKRCVRIEDSRPNARQDALLKHTVHHVNTLQAVSEITDISERENVSSEYDSVYFTESTYNAAVTALGCCISLVDAVARNDRVTNGIALVRPPGHHAMEAEFNGYCFLNNVAVAAQHCVNEGLAEKILIVDFDVHHGQGTQRMFYNRKDVLYFSIHRYEHGTFWPNLIESNFNFTGAGEGLGYNVNVPLNDIGLNEQDYLAIVFHLLLPIAYEFNPDLILISAGYDAAMGCPEGMMKTLPGFYAHLIRLLQGLANGKIAVCLEGGYFVPSLAEGVVCTLKALLNDPCPMLDRNKEVDVTVVESINNVRRALRGSGKWHCFNMFDLDPNERALIKYCGKPDTKPFPTRGCCPSLTDEMVKFYTDYIKNVSHTHNTTALKSCYVYEEDFMLHRPDRDQPDTPEKPERVKAIHDLLLTFGITERMEKLDIAVRDYEDYNVHSKEYMESIAQSTLRQTNDVFFNEHTNNQIKLAVSGLLTIVDRIMEKKNGSGLAVIRPPGHHAEHSTAMGFCLVNNVAIAANYLIKKYSLKRVLIVDFDVHHGNGTQNFFYTRNDVMYVSIHRYDDGRFFPKDSKSNFTNHGYGRGEGYNINIPLSLGKMGDVEYLSIFHNLVLPIAYSFAPEVVLVSAGFDAGLNDPLGGYRCSPEVFAHFVQFLKPLAEGKIILVLEGGYHLTTTAYGMTLCAKALLGDPVPVPRDMSWERMSVFAGETIRNVSRHFERYWPVLRVNKPLPNIVAICGPLGPDSDEQSAVVTLSQDQLNDSAWVESKIKTLSETSRINVGASEPLRNASTSTDD